MNQTHRQRLIERPKEELVKIIIAQDEEMNERVQYRIGSKIRKLSDQVENQKQEIKRLSEAVKKRNDKIKYLKGKAS